MAFENGIFKITENGLDFMFSDSFWTKPRRQQCVMLVLYTCFMAKQKEFGFESLKNIIEKKNLLERSETEFKKLCNELKDNKEACEDFLNVEFN
jgi:citrate lyase synthetase